MATKRYGGGGGSGTGGRPAGGNKKAAAKKGLGNKGVPPKATNPDDGQPPRGSQAVVEAEAPVAAPESAPAPTMEEAAPDLSHTTATPAPIHGQAQFEIAPPAPAPVPTETVEAAPESSIVASTNEPAASPSPDVGIPAEPPPPPAPDNSNQPALLFEVAWEVCWQLGGIYTVLKTKAQTMIQGWGDRYCLIGPYNPATADVEFEEQTPDPLIRETLDRLRRIGVQAKYGRWLVAGRPRTILIDHRSRYNRLGEDKYLMWADHHISTPADDGEVNDVVAFGFAAAEFFRELVDVAHGRPILAHFHEWMGGVAIPRIAHLRLPIATVFTTHATLLGRYLASDNPYFYAHLQYLDPDKEAAHFNIYPRFAIERAAAHASTVFTTVSEVTAVEAAKLLGRAPEGILPNGLNIERFTAVHEFQNLHRVYKERIHEFVMGHFFPAYEFDIESTLYFFTSGRYEYRNKGMDVFIEAMARLNWRLKSEQASCPDPEQRGCTVVAFIVTRAATRNINVGVLQNQTMFDEVRQTIERIQEGLGPVMLKAASYGRFPSAGEMFPEDAKIRWKRAIAAWKNRRQPNIVTHDLLDDARDPILNHLRHRGLFNAADDPVKIVFHPEFMTATSPLLHLDYDQFVRGCHMGIFPSYYEPWGYTPMEAIAMGVPAVTSDLSGFGAYVQRHLPEAAEDGIFVSRRRDRGFDDTVNELVDHLYRFTRLNRRQRIEERNRVERLGEKFDWSVLIKHYDEAHELALSRVGRHVGKVEVRVV